jgi:riboflavin biosynthesis pyrimidine reductase
MTPILSRSGEPTQPVRSHRDRREVDAVEAFLQLVVAAGMTVDFDLPTLTVRTDDGYYPALDQVVDWVIDRTGESRRV